ncbi:hypothetical protein [Aliamphritea spongicola]|nr:hypothetical protein [Aliamphritea spongicola]
MHHIMFDIDGTLVESCAFDEHCYISAVKEITGHTLSSDWHTYPHVTDSGVLQHFLVQLGLQNRFEDIHEQVKILFTDMISAHIQQTRIREIPGAASFIRYLKNSHRSGCHWPPAAGKKPPD